MIFEALYYTENEADDGFRVIEAANLQDAKAVLKAAILAEGNHGRYHLSTLIETRASVIARNS